MTDPVDTAEARRWFARDIAAVAPVVHDPAIVTAFATVPREHYLGPGPWGVHARLAIGDIRQTPTDEAHHVYHDVLIAIDQQSGINNGLPSLWARVYDSLAIQPGATLCQVGAGVGYYTAILAELAGPQGHVIAYEIEPDLAERARHNLRHYSNTEVICADATRARLPELDALTACAGVTHVPGGWLDSLKPNARLVVPYTGVDQWGFLLHLIHTQGGLMARSLGPLGAYHCAGARTEDEARALTAALKSSAGAAPPVGIYHRTPHRPVDGPAWITGASYWISKT